LIDCFGNSTGDLLATATGGFGTYSFSWEKLIIGTYQNVGVGPALNGQSAGEYRVTVTDSNNNTAQDISPLNEPSELKVTFTKTDVLCFGGTTGSINVNITGGTGPYTMDWLDLAGANNPIDRNNLSAGDYAYQVTDNNGCTVDNYSNVITITQPNALSITLVNQTNVLINGQSTGAIDISIFGGTPTYTYQWSKTGDPSFSETTQDLTNINVGEYTVIVSDSNSISSSGSGCIASQSFTITEASVLNISTVITNTLSCFGDTDGQITATASGGSPPFSYSWFEINAGTPTNLGVTTNVINGLVAGEYQVVVNDNNGATVNDIIILTEPSALTFSASSANNVLCFNGSDGSASVTVSGGTPGYTYNWNDANGTTTAQVDELTPGTYDLLVVDNNSCIVNASYSILTEGDCVDVRKIISPNGDGDNDEFIILCAYEFIENELQVFNRWGQLVYNRAGYDNSWNGVTNDGDQAAEGGYFYVFRYTDPGNGQQKEVRGSLTLIR